MPNAKANRSRAIHYNANPSSTWTRRRPYSHYVEKPHTTDDEAGDPDWTRTELVALEEPLLYAVNTVRSAAMIKRSPALAGLTVCKGWTSAATRDLKLATYKVLQANPILTGHVLERSQQLYIQAYTNQHAPFFQSLQPPPNVPSLHNMTGQQLLQTLQDTIVPLLPPCTLTSHQMACHSPLFSVTLLELPDSYAVFCVHVSHAVGDGVTFFHLVKELSLYMSTGSSSTTNNTTTPPTPIHWNMTATHEFFPLSMSQRDVDVSYGWPFYVGLIKNAFGLARRKQVLLLLDKHKVTSIKRQWRVDRNDTTISSNDVITAALCDVNDGTDIFVFTENARSDPMMGGNMLWEIPISKQAASDPVEFRKTVLRKQYYDTNELPLQAFVCGKVGRLTSLATIAEQVLYDGVEQICTVPLTSFVQLIPMDVGVIFRHSKEYYGILHNFAKLQPSQLLEDLIAD